MNGVNNTSNAKSQPAKPTTLALNATVPVSATSTGASTPKTANSTTPSITNGPTRISNGDINAASSNKGKKSAGAAIDPSEVHEMVQNRIAALEGEKVQGGEDDKRSGEIHGFSQTRGL